MCGGTGGVSFKTAEDIGLSPRVRGNPYKDTYEDTRERSIPACAGEPTLCSLMCKSNPVYPRVCGGTSPRYFPRTDGEGLSPRVRGNLPSRSKAVGIRRSIPACAGEPMR